MFSVCNQHKYMELSELDDRQEAELFTTNLREWEAGPQVLAYGAVLVCREGAAVLNVNYKDWELYEGAVITVFPNDVVELKVKNGEGQEKPQQNKPPLFRVEMLKYSPSLLREASLQLEYTVYSLLREDRCRQDTQVVTNIVNRMFALLKLYFGQPECACVPQLVLCQLKAFFIGFHDYLLRNPQYRSDGVKSHRVRELFNRFIALVEKDYRNSRDVNHYAALMNITSKYLTNIVRNVTGHTPKDIIDQYVILQVKRQLRQTDRSIKEIAWKFHFADVSSFCRYFKKHVGLTPQQTRPITP